MADDTSVLVEVKPGWKTSEFWLSLVAMVFTALVGSGLVHQGTTLEHVVASASAILGAMGYAVGRSLVKK